ncbi:MAG: hypothetical protein AAF747_09650 [Planctomycetota bacterium]
MTTTPHRTSHRPPLAVAWACVAWLLVCTSPTQGQPTDPLDITGRNFAAVDLDIEPTPGTIALWGARAQVWTEQPFIVPGRGAEPAVRRVLIEGDVQLALGGLQFTAERAAVWLKQRPEPDGQGREVYQVFVYFDEVGTPTADPALGLSAERLAVRAVIALARPLELRADVINRGRATGAFVEAGERELAAALREQLGLWPISRPPVTEPRSQQQALRTPPRPPAPPAAAGRHRR